jgi:hypothetical protein
MASEYLRNDRMIPSFRALQDAHWMDVVAGKNDDVSNIIIDVTENERKRREAVWELFKSECVFLIDHLMALKHVSDRLHL